MQTNFRAPIFEIITDTSTTSPLASPTMPAMNHTRTKMYNRKERRKMAALARKKEQHDEQ